MLEPNVGKTYLLRHSEIGNGVGKTMALENEYFEELVKK